MKQESMNGSRLSRGLLFIVVAVCTFVLPVGFTASDDYYHCYQNGSCSEPTLSNDSNCQPGTDYDVAVTNKNFPVTVLSFHGGNIEINTSGISNALSSLYGWNRYDFNAHPTNACTSVGAGTYVGNKLHITSTNFNDPRAISLVGAQPKAVAIHGYADSRGYAKGVICVGGKDVSARSAFISYINNNAAAWNANPNTYLLTPIDATTAANGADCDVDEIRGVADDNLVNRTSSHAGLQLELSKGFRADLVNASTGYDDLRNLIYGAIHQSMVEQCVTIDSAVTPWQNLAFASNQTGTFTAEMDATPQGTNIDAGVGLSNGAQTTYTGLACIVRFNTQGKIDARNGGAYAALSQIPYSANTAYHFRLIVNLPAHTYSIYVTPAGGSEQTVGVNYSFRTEQASVAGLNNWSLFSDAGSARACNFVVSGGNTLFQDTFTGADGLITNEYAHWNSDGINSPDWDMTSGSVFRQSNTAWTGLPDSLEPNKYSSDHTDSNVFRVNTFRTFAGNIKVSLALRNNSEIHDPNCGANTCWHGVHIWLRYLSQYDLYAVSLNRADNTVVIKRKVPCGNENEGFYKDLTPALTHAWSVGTWQHYSMTIQTNSDGSVTIKVYDDNADPNTPFLQATDAGGTNPRWTSGCTTPGHYPTAQYPPITGAGSAGVRGDFDNFNFDDFRIFSF